MYGKRTEKEREPKWLSWRVILKIGSVLYHMSVCVNSAFSWDLLASLSFVKDSDAQFWFQNRNLFQNCWVFFWNRNRNKESHYWERKLYFSFLWFQLNSEMESFRLGIEHLWSKSWCWCLLIICWLKILLQRWIFLREFPRIYYILYTGWPNSPPFRC